ncbi:unnamed protein product [Penicillium viridicatum]
MGCPATFSLWQDIYIYGIAPPGTTPIWDVPDEADTVPTSCVQLSDEFKERVRTAFQAGSRWSFVLTELSGLRRILTQSNHGCRTRPTMAEGEYWRCIPDGIKEEIFEITHGAGHLGFHRVWQKCESSLYLKTPRSSARTLTSAINAGSMPSHGISPTHHVNPYAPHAIPFHTLSINFVMGLPRTKKGFHPAATYTEETFDAIQKETPRGRRMPRFASRRVYAPAQGHYLLERCSQFDPASKHPTPPFIQITVCKLRMRESRTTKKVR